MSPQDYTPEEHDRLHEIAETYYTLKSTPMVPTDKKALMEHVEYHLSELVDLLEGIEGTDKLKAMLEQVRKEAEEQAT